MEAHEPSDVVINRAGGKQRVRRVVYYYDDEESPSMGTDQMCCSPNDSKDTEAAELCVATSALAKDSSPAPRRDRIGSPTPITFYAFGMTTLLYNVHTAGIHKLNMTTLGMVLLYGGLTQFIGGFFELVNHNTFGCTISSSYGAFWMGTAAMFLFEETPYVDQLGNMKYSGGFFLMWVAFALSLAFASMRASLVNILLAFLVPLFLLVQCIGNFAESAVTVKVAGYIGIVAGCLAFYIGFALTMYDSYGRYVVPLFHHKNFKLIKM